MPPRQRYDKVLQTLIIALAVLGVASILWLREDIMSRQYAYRACLEFGYTPRACFDIAFNAPKPWESTP